jgi:transposase-like protein
MPRSSARTRRDPAATRRRWIERFARFRHAGQTIAQFCAAEGISAPSFYQWRRRLEAERGGGGPAVEPPPRVVPLCLTPAQSPASVELSLPSGAVFRFGPDTPPEWVAALLGALGGGPC